MYLNREFRRLSPQWGRAALAALAMALASCAPFPQIGAGDQSQLDARINEALNSVCPVPVDPGSIQDRLRMLRGQLVLASIAGYASRSISSYAAGDDIQSDGMLVLQRLKVAGDELAKAAAATEEENHLFPLYRADLVVAAGSAAEAALRPSIRAAKATLTSTLVSSDTTLRAKTMLLNLLKNELYSEALQESCQRLNKTLGAVDAANGAVVLATLPDEKLKRARKFTDDRLTDRCNGLKALVGKSADGDYCKAQWP